MNVITRIKAIRLMEKIEANKDFADRQGIKLELKKIEGKKQSK